jgi:hypothetical protein
LAERRVGLIIANMKTHRTKPAAAAAPVAVFPFAQALADLVPKLIKLDAMLDENAAKRRAAEERGEHSKPLAKKADEDQLAAVDVLSELLNGSADGHEVLKKKSKSAPLAALEQEHATFIRAKEIGTKLYEELRTKARAELGEARKAEFDALMKQKAVALISLERIEQAIDATCKGTDLVPYNLPGAGRFHISGSPLHVFLEWCSRTGVITEREFADEWHRARKAAGLE